MKNVILGMIGTLIIVYTAVISLGITHEYIHRQNLRLCLSEVLPMVMENCYRGDDRYLPPEKGDGIESAESLFYRAVQTRMGDACAYQAEILVCDMERGILSARLTEEVHLPGGRSKSFSCRKTILVDRIEEEGGTDGE